MEHFSFKIGLQELTYIFFISKKGGGNTGGTTNSGKITKSGMCILDYKTFFLFKKHVKILHGLEMATVMIQRTPTNATMMAETVVDLISTLNIVANVSA